MPWWIYIYVTCIGIIVLLNVIYWMMVKQKFLITVYELTAGSYLIFMVLAYWVPWLKNSLSLVNIPAVFSIIVINFYFTVWRKKNIDIKQILPYIDEDQAQLAREFAVVEVAKSVPVIFNAPAYIIGAMLCFDLVKQTFHFYQ